MASALSFEVGGKEEPLPGFDDAVRGAVADDVRSFSFPAEAGEYEGKDIDVTVTVTTVRERELPAADDDFALMASEFDTMDELTEDVRTRLVRMKRVEQGVQARTKLHEQLVDSVDFPLPESLIARELEEHFHDGHGDEDHKAEFESEARGRIKSAILLDRIAEENELTVAQEELSAWLMQQAPRYGMTPDQFANELVAGRPGPDGRHRGAPRQGAGLRDGEGDDRRPVRQRGGPRRAQRRPGRGHGGRRPGGSRRLIAAHARHAPDATYGPSRPGHSTGSRGSRRRERILGAPLARRGRRWAAAGR